MITFRSTATGQIQMLDADGTRLLAAIGKGNPSRGVIMPLQMDDAIARLQEMAESSSRMRDVAARRESVGDDADVDAVEPVSLAQRVYPLLQMLKNSRFAGAPVLWGV